MQTNTTHNTAQERDIGLKLPLCLFSLPCPVAHQQLIIFDGLVSHAAPVHRHTSFLPEMFCQGVFEVAAAAPVAILSPSCLSLSCFSSHVNEMLTVALKQHFPSKRLTWFHLKNSEVMLSNILQMTAKIWVWKLKTHLWIRTLFFFPLPLFFLWPLGGAPNPRFGHHGGKQLHLEQVEQWNAAVTLMHPS